MKSGIYRIYNKVNGKIYIGQATNVNNRLRCHINELRKGTHINYFLLNDFNEYGEDNFIFEKIHSCEEEFLNTMEKYFIEKFNTTNNGYNIKGGNNTINNKIKLLKKQEAKIKEKARLEKENEKNQFLLQEFKSIEEINIDVDELTYNAYEFQIRFQELAEKYLEDDEDVKIKVPNNIRNAISFVDRYVCDNIDKVIDSIIVEKCIEFFKKYDKVINLKIDKYNDGFYYNPMRYYDTKDKKTIIAISYLELNSKNKGFKEIFVNLKSV